MVPNEFIILLAGIPATGKSTFARYLERSHAFVRYDLECPAKCWPRPRLHTIWERNRREFVAALRAEHRSGDLCRIVLDWGFPPACIRMVEEVLAEGVRLVWFAGNPDRARVEFTKRGGLDVEIFDSQLAQIHHAGLPSGLECVVVDALSDAGIYLTAQELEAHAFS